MNFGSDEELDTSPIWGAGRLLALGLLATVILASVAVLALQRQTDRPDGAGPVPH